MSALTSLLARDQVVAVRRIEEALQRQVIAGGDIDTALLEIGGIEENVLASYRASSFNLQPCSVAEVMDTTAELLDSVPRALCELYRAVPIGTVEDAIIVAVAKPLLAEEERRLRREAGQPIQQRITTEYRIAVALNKHFETPLAKRFVELTKTLGSAPAGALTIVPRSVPPRPNSGTPSASGGEASSPPVVGSASGAPQAVARASFRPGSSARVQRGPLIPRIALEELGVATSRANVTEIVFSFARQFFDTCVLYRVLGQTIEIEVVDGDNAPTAASVTFEAGGAVARVVNTAESFLGGIRDTAFRRRPGAREPSSGAAYGGLFPLLIGPRVIFLLYGDRNGQPFSRADVIEIIEVLEAAGHALERVIREKKRRRDEGLAESERPRASTAGGVNEPIATAVVLRRDGAEAIAPQAVVAEGEGAGRDFVPPAPRVPQDVIVASSVVVVPASTRRTHAPVRTLRIPESAPPPPPFERILPSVLRAVGVPANPPQNGSTSEAAASPRSPDLTAIAREVLRDTLVDAEPAGAAAANSEPGANDVTRDGAAPTADGAAAQTSSDEIPIVYTERPPVEARAPSGEHSRSIIVDLGSDVEQSVDQIANSTRATIVEMVANAQVHGESLLPVLLQRFPGIIWADPKTATSVRDVSPIAYTMIAYRAVSGRYLAPLLDSRDVEGRFIAVSLAQEISHAALVEPLGRRIFDEDASVREKAMSVLATYHRFTEFRGLFETFRALARVPSRDRFRRLQATRALGVLRDTRAPAVLITLLSESDVDVVSAARTALISITGHDADTDIAKWQRWLDLNGERHRIEWLIDALMSGAEDLRARAGEELERITGQMHGYRSAITHAERLQIQRRYREWWEREGKARFAQQSSS